MTYYVSSGTLNLTKQNLNRVTAGSNRANMFGILALGAPSSSRNEYYLGGIIALLLQDHRTLSTKSVCIAASIW